jgi:hypothetical protein
LGSYHAVRFKFTDVSDKRNASIFRAEDMRRSKVNVSAGTFYSTAVYLKKERHEVGTKHILESNWRKN